METKRFTKNDEGFLCAHCKKQVLPLGYSSRDHCPHCLHSLHVDELPGDRKNECRGDLVPVQSLPDPKKGFILLYRCAQCGKTVRCMAARDDDRELLIALTKNPN